LHALVATTEKRYATSLGEGRNAMRIALLLLAVMAASATPMPASARIQPDIVCWDSDMEFPVACDLDDD
jgi:hypothetical protein